MTFSFVDRFLDGLLVFFGKLIFIVGLHFLSLIDGIFKHVLGFGALALFLVFFGVGFGFLGSFFYFGFVQVAAAADGDALLFTGTLVLGGDVQDAIGIDVEGHLDLRHARWRR